MGEIEAGNLPVKSPSDEIARWGCSRFSYHANSYLPSQLWQTQSLQPERLKLA